jgi:hypothetical protein
MRMQRRIAVAEDLVIDAEATSCSKQRIADPRHVGKKIDTPLRT